MKPERSSKHQTANRSMLPSTRPLLSAGLLTRIRLSPKKSARSSEKFSKRFSRKTSIHLPQPAAYLFSKAAKKHRRIPENLEQRIRIFAFTGSLHHRAQGHVMDPVDLPIIVFMRMPLENRHHPSTFR